jgi:hypothetical protein
VTNNSDTSCYAVAFDHPSTVTERRVSFIPTVEQWGNGLEGYVLAMKYKSYPYLSSGGIIFKNDEKLWLVFNTNYLMEFYPNKLLADIDNDDIMLKKVTGIYASVSGGNAFAQTTSSYKHEFEDYLQDATGFVTITNLDVSGLPILIDKTEQYTLNDMVVATLFNTMMI